MIICYGVDWQALMGELDHQVFRAWMVLVDVREPEGIQDLEVKTVFLVEKALLVEQV